MIHIYFSNEVNQNFQLLHFQILLFFLMLHCPQSVKNQNAPCVFQKEKFRPELLLCSSEKAGAKKN